MAVQNWYRVTKWDLLVVFGGVVTLVLDWGSDCATAYRHYKNTDYMWFGLTVSFMILSSLVIMGVSLYWFLDEGKSSQNANVSRYKRRARLVLIILQLSPLVRYGNTLWCGYQSLRHRKLRNKEGEDERKHEEKQKEYYIRMVFEGSDSMFLRMFECFFESAPQLILQLYILGQADDSEKYDNRWHFMMVATSLTSLVSLAWGVTGFTRSARLTDINKENISIHVAVVILSWHMCLLAARAAAMVLFALVFQFGLVYLCVGHWALMSAVLMFRRFNTTDDSPRLWKIILSCLMGIVYIFVFLNDKDEPTRKKYIAFYTFWELENVAMLVMWLMYGDQTRAFYLPAVIFHFSAFFLGITVMLIYYRFLHPNVSQPHRSSNSTPLQKEHNTEMVALEDKAGVNLEDRAGVDLEDRAGVDLEDRAGVDL